MNAVENPYAFGIAPLSDQPKCKDAGAESRNSRINVKWTAADVIMILVSGVAGFAFWSVTGLVMGLITYLSAMASNSLPQVIAKGLLLIMMAMGPVVTMAAMFITYTSIRRWKICRMMRSPAGLVIAVEEPDYDHVS